MHLKLLTTTLVALGLSSFSHADFIGAKADLSYWNFNGYSQTAEQLPTTVGSQYDLKRQGTVQLSVAFEHPIPLLPNAKLKYVNLDSASDSNPWYRTDIELSQTDYILYYELLDNIVSADLGLGVANLKGDVQQQTGLAIQHYDIDDYMPLIYAQAGVKLPFTGLSARAEAVYASLDDTSIQDIQAELQYNFVESLVVNLGAKIGYRQMLIETEDKQSPDLKMKFKGPYLGLDIHF